MLFIIHGVQLLIVMPRANASYIFISFFCCVKDRWVMYLLQVDITEEFPTRF